MMSITTSSQQHSVFLGLTRPPHYAGVNLYFFLCHGFLQCLLLIMSQSFVPLLISFPCIHVLGLALSRYEPAFMNILRVYVQCSVAKNAHYWGCHSYAPW